MKPKAERVWALWAPKVGAYEVFFRRNLADFECRNSPDDTKVVAYRLVPIEPKKRKKKVSK